MKHLFVPFEIAKQLRKKGFNEPCLANYYEDGSLIPDRSSPEEGDEDTNFSTSINSDSVSTTWTTAPLYQQVIDWLSNKGYDVVSFRVSPIDSKLVWVVYYLNQNENPFLHGKHYINHGMLDKPINHWDDKYESLNKTIEEVLKLIPDAK